MDNLRGIGLMVTAMAFFALGDMTIKWATQIMPVAQVLALLGLGGGLVFASLCKAKGHKVLTRDFLRGPIILRNSSEVVGTMCMFLALARVDLSLVAAILQATPVAVTFGAAVLLGEHVGWRRWAATLVGFVGVLIIMRPGMTGFQPDSLWALVAMVALALRDLSTRMVPHSVPTLRIATYGMSMLAPAGLVLMLAAQPPVAMNAASWGLMALMVTVGVLGYHAITSAMRVGEVSAVSPFRYSRMVFALAIGVLVFGERPDLWTLVGTALTIAAGLYTFLRERRPRRAS
ncbi:DMT family transporter [Aliiroseovarius subalbicans]|uniref:DMT family transporter n=1 Tax=Aliiroseovarius subalbicans TaxID=2925840 RepID=UPI001F56A43E|nr:DMT family transporter [Aliiroseovarius subalbicans]MCI2398769.1 DMT family transporter [Aliiroseovarius subalbicans]